MKVYQRSCKHPRILWIAITLAGIFLDQLTKLLVSGSMRLHESITVIPGLFSITYHQNRGAAWGMLADHRWVFILVSTITIAGLLAFLILTKRRDPLMLSALAMILSGGIGNMIDRLALGYVVDMIHAVFIDFPIFNVADSLVCVGAVLLFIAVLFEAKEEGLEKKTAESEDVTDDAADL